MMKRIVVSASYPEDKADEIFDALAAGFDWNEEKHGDKFEFIEASLNVRFNDLLKGTYHVGYRKLNNIPQRNPIRTPAGLGDSIAMFIDRWITIPVGRAFKWLSMNCGCDKRRQWLNKHFPYKNKTQ